VSFLDVPAPHGHLEALLWDVPAPKAAAVVCHPHPLHGGTMHNHVTYRLADAFREAGVAALRFNFRGVGRSTGTHDEGRGEVDDARAALDALAERHPGVPLIAAGFSFGARVALRLTADDARVTRGLATGLALDLFDFGFVEGLGKPKAFIQSDHDEFARLEDVRSLVRRLQAPARLFVLEGSDHLATGRLDAFAALAKEAVAWLLSA
jgi:uncharacterized protein